MKPERYTFAEICKMVFVNPVFDLWLIIKKEFLGYWYCHYCMCYHSPLVKEYKGKKETKGLANNLLGNNYIKVNVCSLGEGEKLETNNN